MPTVEFAGTRVECLPGSNLRMVLLLPYRVCGLPGGRYYGRRRRGASLARMIRSATPADVPSIARLIRALAEYEKLSHEVVLREEDLHQHLFGPRPYAEVVLADFEGAPAGFALFFHNFSTFVGRAGLYLEDLFVRPALRGHGIGKELLRFLAHVAEE